MNALRFCRRFAQGTRDYEHVDVRRKKWIDTVCAYQTPHEQRASLFVRGGVRVSQGNEPRNQIRRNDQRSQRLSALRMGWSKASGRKYQSARHQTCYGSLEKKQYRNPPVIGSSGPASSSCAASRSTSFALILPLLIDMRCKACSRGAASLLEGCRGALAGFGGPCASRCTPCARGMLDAYGGTGGICRGEWPSNGGPC